MTGCGDGEGMGPGLHTGQLVGHPRYQEVQYLKGGAFGQVVLARDAETGGLVALKLLPRAQAGASHFAEAEVLNHCRLRHPHIVRLSEVFLAEEHLVLVLEYAAGGDLASRIPSGVGLPEDQARWLFTQLLFALEYCHRMGIADRDIKLENVLLDSADSCWPIVKLADFGLSAACDSASGLVLHDGAVGTPAYFAPELLTGHRGQPYDAKEADVWSCGVLLYSMVTGRCPFRREGDAELGLKEALRALLQRIQRVDYLLPHTLSPECRDLIASMLVADPRRRPTVREVMAHPWCRKGLDPAAMLACNDRLFEQSRAPGPEVLQEIRDILEEARMTPATPQARTGRARQMSLDEARGSSEEEALPAAAATAGGTTFC